jgi:hypothetical protein
MDIVSVLLTDIVWAPLMDKVLAKMSGYLKDTLLALAMETELETLKDTV